MRASPFRRLLGAGGLPSRAGSISVPRLPARLVAKLGFGAACCELVPCRPCRRTYTSHPLVTLPTETEPASGSATDGGPEPKGPKVGERVAVVDVLRAVAAAKAGTRLPSERCPGAVPPASRKPGRGDP